MAAARRKALHREPTAGLRGGKWQKIRNLRDVMYSVVSAEDERHLPFCRSSRALELHLPFLTFHVPGLPSFVDTMAVSLNTACFKATV